MGLAGPKNKTKIGHDPRNTFWSNDTSRFGHKYLSKQGWTQGESLGDKNQAYFSSGHITDASWSGVKVALKADNLGIGAKSGAQDDCTGLLGLEGLLARLNGDEKTVERVKKQEAANKVEFFNKKFGMRFVKGEVLNADEIFKLRQKMIKDGLVKVEEEEPIKEKGDVKEEDAGSDVEAKPKKRKRTKNEYSPSGSSKKSKSKKPRSPEDNDEESESNKKSTEPSDNEKKSKSKSRKDRKSKEKDRNDKRKEKKEKKEKRKKEKSKKENNSTPESSSSESEKEEAPAVPAKAVIPVPPALTGRRAIRARYIAAKRNATMDSKSLNEILMVSA